LVNTFVVNAGQTEGETACATINIMDDTALEFDHDFTVSIGASNPPGATLHESSFSETTVTIQDDEGSNLDYLEGLYVYRLLV